MVHCALPNLKCNDYGSHWEWIISQLKLDGHPKGDNGNKSWMTYMWLARTRRARTWGGHGAAAEAEEHSDYTQMKAVNWKSGAGVNFFLVIEHLILWELGLEQGQRQQAQNLSWMKVASNDKSVYVTKKTSKT